MPTVALMPVDTSHSRFGNSGAMGIVAQDRLDSTQPSLLLVKVLPFAVG